MIRTLPELAFVLLMSTLWLPDTAVAHAVHTRADSVDGQAMGAVVVEYHKLLSSADSTAYGLLAPAYSSFEMNGHADPKRWLAGALLPAEFQGGWPDGGDAPERYENEVEVIHALTRWNRGIVITHEVGSFRDGAWDSYNAWILMRVSDAWRIGASIHGLPEELRRQLIEDDVAPGVGETAP